MKRMKELKRKLSVLLVITLFISGLPVSYADVWASDDFAEYDLISDEGSTDVLREESDAGITEGAGIIENAGTIEDTGDIGNAGITEGAGTIDISGDGDDPAGITETADDTEPAAEETAGELLGGDRETGTGMKIVDGMAAPMVSFSEIKPGYTNKGSDILRFAVYVETDYDTDRDGMNDLVQAVVQVPRAAAEQKYDAPTIFEASPYLAGTITDTGLGNMVPDPKYDPSFDENSLYQAGAYRTTSEDTIKSLDLAMSDDKEEFSSKNWYYQYENAPEGKRESYYNKGLFNNDYFLVRGFALVVSAGLGTNGSDGLETCGSRAEAEAFKDVVEWIHHKKGRRAFADREGTIPVEADWSNGKVAMRGSSYNGTMAYEVAATGVEGLETIVPEAGISSWYEYSNTQGVSHYFDNMYTTSLASGNSSRFFGKDPGDPGDTSSTSWNAIRGLCSDLFGSFDHSETELAGHYGDFWGRREFSNWETLKDRDKIHASALIIQGLNDYNVRTKQADLMRRVMEKNGQDVRMILHQGCHETLETVMAYRGMFFLELLNKWYCHYLLDIDNGIENTLPKVCVQSNKDGFFYDYDEWYRESWYDDANRIITVSSGNAKQITLSKPVKQTDGVTGGNPRRRPDPAGNTLMKSGDDPYFTIDDYFEQLNISPDTEGTEGKVYSETWMRYIPEEVMIQGKPVVKVRAAVHERPASGRMVLGAMLYDISSESFPAYEANPGDPDSMRRVIVKSGGIDFGGEIGSLDYEEFGTTGVKKKLITKGAVDLSRPDSEGAGYEPWKALSGNAAPGEYHDYTIHMLPTFYTVRPGHYLWLYLIPDMDSIASDTDIDLDNAGSRAMIPVSGIPEGFYDAPHTELADDGQSGSAISEKIGGKEVARKIIEKIGDEERITTLSSNIWIRGLGEAYLYEGSPVKPVISVYDGTDLLSEGRDYKISYKDNTKPTEISGKKSRLIITFRGEYAKTSKITETFEIAKFDLSVNKVYASSVTAAYTGKNLKPVPEIRLYDECGMLINKKNFKFSYLKDGDKEAGESVRDPGHYTIYIEPRDAGSYFRGWTYTDLTVTAGTQRPLELAKVKFDPVNYVYTGRPIMPPKGSYTLICKLDGKNYTTLSENIDYKVILSRNNVEPGKAEIVFSAVEGNDKGLKGSVTGTFNIKKGRNLNDLAPGDLEYESIIPFSGNGAIPSWVNVYDGDRKLTEGKDYTVSYSDNKEVTAQAVITFKGKGRYKGTVTRNYEIVECNIAGLDISVSDKLMKKGAGYRDPDITVTDGGRKLKKNKDYKIESYESVSDNEVSGVPDDGKPGRIRVTIKGMGNYFGTATADYMYYDQAHDLSKATTLHGITPRVCTGHEIMLTDKELDELLIVGRKGADPGTYLGYGYDFYIESYKNNIKVGTATVTFRGKGEYGGSKTLKFKIDRRDARDYIGIL